MEKLKIIFLGSPDFAIPTLKNLLQDGRFEILGAITQIDKPAGRGQTLTPPPVKKFALENNLPVWQPEKLKEIKEKIAELAPDFLVVVAYGKLVPKSILDIPKYGCINIHGSILPRYRGSAVIQAPILNGDNETGATIMLMDENLDTGPIIKILEMKLNGTETAQNIHDALSLLGAKNLPQILIDLAEGKIQPQAQKGESVYVKEIKKEDGRIDWNKPAKEIERLVRAFTPWPSTFSNVPLLYKERLGEVKEKINTNSNAPLLPEERLGEVEEKINTNSNAPLLSEERLGEVGGKIQTKLIKILEVDNNILSINKFEIGEVFLENKNLTIQCGDGALIIKKLQLEGGKPLSAEEFLRGHQDFAGTILK